QSEFNENNAIGIRLGTWKGRSAGGPVGAGLGIGGMMAMLVGHVMWQGRGAQPGVLQIEALTLTLRSATTEVYYGYQVTDASGFFTLPLGTLLPDVYDWRLKGPAYLSTSSSFALTLGGNNVDMGLQRAGDITGDNVINV